MTGIGFVSPFRLKEKKQELKAYVIVLSCGTSRGVRFTATGTMETSEFIARLNEFIVVCSHPQEIVSDNASTFKAAAAWIKKLMQSEELHEYLEYHSIKWDFILPKSPWRGGFWESVMMRISRPNVQDKQNNNYTNMFRYDMDQNVFYCQYM